MKKRSTPINLTKVIRKMTTRKRDDQGNRLDEHRHAHPYDYWHPVSRVHRDVLTDAEQSA